ncbi:hypothetical protein [Sulfitobacter sp. SH24]|uniref:hypothetical protein n=1 Tax=Sulfitobacter sp. SH24 TaxID=3421173 RepID=UPI003F4F832F
MIDTKPDGSDSVWIEWFSKKMDEATPEEEAFWKRRRLLGLGVGLDENGNIVSAKDVLRAEIYRSVSMVNQDEACVLLGLSGMDPAATLTRHEDDGQILRFDNEGQAAYPLFQFDVIRQRFFPVLIELMKMRLNDWDSQMALIHWLTRPNCSLGGARPCDKLAEDANAILASFRAEISEHLHR